MTRTLIAAGILLFLLMLALDYNVAQPLWPTWLVRHSDTLIGLLGLATLALVFFGPVIVEVDSHPRPLSGPGHDPRHHGEG